MDTKTKKLMENMFKISSIAENLQIMGCIHVEDSRELFHCALAWAEEFEASFDEDSEKDYLIEVEDFAKAKLLKAFPAKVGDEREKRQLSFSLPNGAKIVAVTCGDADPAIGKTCGWSSIDIVLVLPNGERAVLCAVDFELAGGSRNTKYESFLKYAYELHKYEWCEERGYDIENWDEEFGFGGESFVCLAEFEDNEFADEECMEALLPNNGFFGYWKQLRENYLNDATEPDGNPFIIDTEWMPSKDIVPCILHGLQQYQGYNDIEGFYINEPDYPRYDPEKLLSQQALIDMLEEYGGHDRAMSHVREHYENELGSDPIWRYPISLDTCNGGFIVPVKEGYLFIPYDEVDAEDYEILMLDKTCLMDSETCEYMARECLAYTDALCEELLAISKELATKQSKEW